MKKRNFSKRIFSFAATCTLLLGCTACSKSEDYPKEIPNGDFEEVSADGKWIDWTRKDAAFGVRGIIRSDKVNGVEMEKSGEYFFSGSDGGNQVMRGTLTSKPFKLTGTGFISFKMGAGKDNEKCYVEFFEEGNETPIAKVSNTDCDGIFITDQLLTKVVDLSAYLNKTIYIVATDNDDGNDFSYLNLDAFQVCQSEEDIKAAEEEYAQQIKTYGPKPFEEDETSVTIQNGGFETGTLEGWQVLEGNAFSNASIIPTSQYYWTDRSTYGDGNFYLDGSNNGSILESLTGAIRSSKFTLAGDGYISFMIGAAPSNCYVAICDGNTGEELIVINNEYFNDPALPLTLLRVYVDASEYLGKVLYIKIVDANDASGFAFINADDFRVSLTAQEVAELEVAQLEKIQNETYTSESYNDLASLLSYYTEYPYPVPLSSLTLSNYAQSQVVDCGTVNINQFISGVTASFGSEKVDNVSVFEVVYNGKTYTEGFDAFDMSQPGYYRVTYGSNYRDKTASASFTIVAVADHNQVANGGFESGDLTGWTVLTDGWAYIDGAPAGVISADTYWGEALPYNQEGQYHLDGWNTGIEEGSTWNVQSSKFTLSGSGYISVRMGGHAAAVQVFLADGTQIGYYRQNRFSDTNFPSLAAGGSWADMGTYVMDLSSYIGQEMYLVLCDEQADGWAHAFFDDVITYYETAPDYSNNKDIVADGGTGEEVSISWQLAPNQM